MNKIELDKDYLKTKILEVLKIAHVDSRKLKIIEHSDRLQYSCPICMDSMKNPGTSRGMRGTLYFKNLSHICFNEGCNMSFTKLLENFNIPIDLDKKINIYNYIDANISYSKSEDNFVVQKLSKLIDVNELTEFFNNNPEHQIVDFGKVKPKSAVYQYLKYNRFIENFDNLYEAKFRINSKWIEPVVVILNKAGDKVIGMQIRNLKDEKTKRLFKIYNFEKIYNIMNPDDPLDEIEAISYNKLSNFYNILNVNSSNSLKYFLMERISNSS